MKKNGEVPSEDVKIRKLIEKKRNTATRDKQHLRKVSKQLRKCIRDKKRSKRQERIQRILEEFRGVKNISCIKLAKKKVLIPKVTNDEGDTITCRR